MNSTTVGAAVVGAVSVETIAVGPAPIVIAVKNPAFDEMVYVKAYIVEKKAVCSKEDVPQPRMTVLPPSKEYLPQSGL